MSSTSAPHPVVTLEVRDRVARVRIDRPPLNVLTIAALGELNAALERAGGRPVNAVVLSAGGKAFSAGLDVAEHLPDRAAGMLAAFHRTAELLAEIEPPTIAAVHGAALGGGCELALLCDIVVCAEGARLGLPEIGLAALAPVAAALLPRLCGPKRALELLLTGETLDAREAERIGLVNRVVPADRLEAEVDALAARLALSSGAALRLAKGAAVRGLGVPVPEALADAEAVCLEMLTRLPDSEEGMRAFLEKRQPRWSGG
jgi:cyclohexa-1,5-dienecarbonyl-CoA hydratase